MPSRFCTLAGVLVLAGIELSGCLAGRLIASAQEAGPAPEWFSGFPSPSPNAPTAWDALRPQSPFPGATWQLYIASNGTLCAMYLDGRTAFPSQPLNGFRGVLNMGHGMFPSSSGDRQVLFVAPGSASPQPIMAFAPGPPLVSLGDLGVVEGAEVAGTVVDSADLTADATYELLTGVAGPGYPSFVQIVSAGRDEAIKLFPFGPEYTGGLTFATGNFDGEGYQEFAVGQAGPPGRVKIFGLQGENVLYLADGFPLGQRLQGGVNLESIDLNNDKADDLIVTPRSGLPVGRAFGFKISDNEAPRPTARLYFEYSFFENTRVNGVRVAAGLHDGRVFLASSTDDQVRVAIVNTLSQTFDVIRTDTPFGRNSAPVSVTTIPPQPQR